MIVIPQIQMMVINDLLKANELQKLGKKLEKKTENTSWCPHKNQ